MAVMEAMDMLPLKTMRSKPIPLFVLNMYYTPEALWFLGYNVEIRVFA